MGSVVLTPYEEYFPKNEGDRYLEEAILPLNVFKQVSTSQECSCNDSCFVRPCWTRMTSPIHSSAEHFQAYEKVSSECALQTYRHYVNMRQIF